METPKRKSKLDRLAEIEGRTVEGLLEASMADSVVPGICMEPDCDYTTGVEPDCRKGYCELCGKQAVRSALVLAGVI